MSNPGGKSGNCFVLKIRKGESVYPEPYVLLYLLWYLTSYFYGAAPIEVFLEADLFLFEMRGITVCQLPTRFSLFYIRGTLNSHEVSHAHGGKGDTQRTNYFKLNFGIDLTMF